MTDEQFFEKIADAVASSDETEITPLKIVWITLLRAIQDCKFEEMRLTSEGREVAAAGCVHAAKRISKLMDKLPPEAQP